jgi:hypothetical protein
VRGITPAPVCYVAVVKIFVMPCIAAGDTRRIRSIGSADAGADGGTERRSGTGGKESAAIT